MRESGGKFNGEDRRGDTGTPEPSCYILLHVCGFGRACPVPCAFATLALAAPACLVLAHPKIIVEGSDLHMKRHRFQDTPMTSENFVRREGCVKSLASELSTRLAFKIQKCQEQAGSIESGSTRQRCREQEMLRTRDRAVDGRASQAVRGRSYRLSLVFLGSSMFFLSKFPSSGLPGLYL